MMFKLNQDCVYTHEFCFFVVVLAMHIRQQRRLWNKSRHTTSYLAFNSFQERKEIYSEEKDKRRLTSRWICNPQDFFFFKYAYQLMLTYSDTLEKLNQDF